VAGPLAGSVHGALACGDCHAGLDASNLPHATPIPGVECTGCHTDPGAAHAFHPTPVGTCEGCHGGHEVRRATADDGPFARARLAKACGECHGDVALHFLESSHGRSLSAGFSHAPDCLGCHREPLTRARDADPRRVALAQQEHCLSCHVDDPAVRERIGPSAGFLASYERSVHGRAVAEGNPAAATCVSCHGAHEVLGGTGPGSHVGRENIPETCAQCHGEIALQYRDSIHGIALGKGVREAPVCTDCHGEHEIYSRDDPRSPVAPANISAQVCTPCHASFRVLQKYAIAGDRVGSFADSYHGLALRGGSVEAANCASCHGVHDILPSAMPASRVHKDNLPQTCGQQGCHAGAGARFAVGSVHVVVDKEQEPVLFWITFIYVGMIVGTVGGMLAHNALDFAKKIGHKLSAHRHGHADEPLPHRLYLRMTTAERLQHVALVVSFAVLVITGFMLRFPEAWWVTGLRRMSPHLFEWRTLLHRVAAVVMVAASAFHVGYLALTARGRQLFWDMVPARKDVWDVVGALRYYTNLSRVKPRFARFSYIEKAEYWALIWGTIVMAVTGAVLWFDNTFMNILTKLGTDIARTIHFYEAVLATLAIIVWHFYFVLFNPDVYPMSFAWLTGYLTEHQMEEEHGLELDALRRRQAEAELAAASATTDGTDEGGGDPSA
jgi:cytochrome b subunit of formate dehydrogenase